jgi:pyruvate dehydrogenase E1 component
LYRDAIAADRWNRLNPGKTAKVPYVQSMLQDEEGVFIAASDWVKMTPGCLHKWMPEQYDVLGTDGFGLSESRESLRNYFEISARYIAFAAVRQLNIQGKVSDKAVKDFMKKYDIDADKADPMEV